MRSFVAPLLLTLFAVLLTGCAGQRYVVSVDGLVPSSAHDGLVPSSEQDGLVPSAAQGGASPSRALILPLEPDASKDDPLFRELVAQLGPALRERGIEPVEEGAGADMAVYFGYAVSGPRTDSITVREPMWRNAPMFYDYSHPVGRFSMRLEQNFGRERRWTFYTCGFDLVARELPPAGSPVTEDKGRLLWQLHVLSMGPENNDLRRMFPIMLEAARPYIARDTDGVLDVSVDEDEGALSVVAVQ